MTDTKIDREYDVAVSDPDSGQRLDKFLGDTIDELSRTRLKSLIENGYVSLASGSLTEPSRRVNSGETIHVQVPAATPARPIGQDIALEVVFEDDDLIVINKPPGLVVHPAPGNPDRTLVNALIAHCGAGLSGIGGELRPGIVHRLDKDTSGLMVAAKNDLAHQGLAKQFADHSLDRAYKALIWGVPAVRQGDITGNIGRNPRNRKKMAVVTRGGKTAATRYRVLRQINPSACLAECRLSTGRTHQIRVHMASIGHPVIGDPLYGGGETRKRSRSDPDFAGLAASLGRQALHAYLIGFNHPLRGKRLKFECDIPDDMKRLL